MIFVFNIVHKKIYVKKLLFNFRVMDGQTKDTLVMPTKVLDYIFFGAPTHIVINSVDRAQ